MRSPRFQGWNFSWENRRNNIKKATWVTWTRWDRSGPDPLLLHIHMIIVKDLEKNLLFLHTAMPEEKSTLDKEHFKNQYQESEWTKEEKKIELIRRTC